MLSPVVTLLWLQISAGLKVKEPTIIDICHILYSEENVIDNLSVAKPQMSILDASISRVKTMFI